MIKYSRALIVVCLLLFENRAYAQWVQTNGPYGGRVNSIVVIGDNIFAGTSGGGVFRSTDNGTSWTAVNSGLPITSDYPFIVSDFTASGDNIFAATEKGVFRSTDNGTSWTISDSSFSIETRSLALSGDNIFAATDQGVFRSTNNGTTWTTANSGLPMDTVPLFMGITSLAVSGNNIFAGTIGLNCGGVFLSTDNGVTWTSASLGLPTDIVPMIMVPSFIVSFAVSDNNIFAATGGYGGVFLSTNNGTNWIEVNSGFPNPTSVSSLAASGGNILAVHYTDGIFLSTNNGNKWTAVDAGLTNIEVTSLSVSGNTIYAGTNGSGVWRRPLSEMIDLTDVHPREEPINQAPFKIGVQSRAGSALSVEFNIPHSKRVAVTMHDLAGREISSLVNQHFDAGSYRYLWDTRTFAQGCFMLKMQVGRTTYTKLVQTIH